jgi:hypothetical protein
MAMCKKKKPRSKEKYTKDTAGPAVVVWFCEMQDASSFIYIKAHKPTLRVNHPHPSSLRKLSRRKTKQHAH